MGQYKAGPHENRPQNFAQNFMTKIALEDVEVTPVNSSYQGMVWKFEKIYICGKGLWAQVKFKYSTPLPTERENWNLHWSPSKYFTVNIYIRKVDQKQKTGIQKLSQNISYFKATAGLGTLTYQVVLWQRYKYNDMKSIYTGKPDKK